MRLAICKRLEGDEVFRLFSAARRVRLVSIQNARLITICYEQSLRLMPMRSVRDRVCSSFRHTIAAFIVLTFCLVFPRPVSAQGSILFYVAHNGDDGWSGLLPKPNQNLTDGPFATLERAREAVRQSLAEGLHPGVRIREGLYRFERSLELDSSDSGTDADPIIWSNYKNESVRFSGGRVIEGFGEIRDSAVLARIKPEFRGTILRADLKSQGVTDFGVMPNRTNLFFNGSRMSVSRFPNKGWLMIGLVPQDAGPVLNQGDKKVIKNGLPAGRHCGRFRCDDEAPLHWASSNDIWLHGFFVWDWRDAYQRVEHLDTATGMVFPAEPHHYYGYQQGQRYCFLNVLEELDRSGEWVLDEARGVVYFWPPSSLKSGDVTVSMLKEPMLLLRNTAHVQIRSIIFEASRACAVKILGGTHNLVAGCTVRNIDNDTSIVVDGGTSNGVRGCDIVDIGSTGIRIVGGDRRTLTPAGNFAINNHISRFGEILHTFNGGVFLNGVGDTVSHNLIHDGPSSGIQYYGNDHLIEYNEIHDLAHESGDVGGINTGADYSEMGTVIRYNYIHDTHGYGEGGFRAIYLDLPGSNTAIYGNILANVDIGVFFNSGRDNVVRNNIFFNCHPSVNIYIWPHGSYFRPGGAWKIVEKLHAINYKDPPYSLRYPMLPRYLDSSSLGMPYGHVVSNNISLGGTWLDLSEELNFTHVKVEKNVVADTMLLVQTRKWYPDFDPYHIGYAGTYTMKDPKISREMKRRRNVLADPLLENPAGGNFRPSAKSPAWKAGFEPIPFESIGLVVDEFRTSVPEKNP
jgi:parallel beta-helix repeat protein